MPIFASIVGRVRLGFAAAAAGLVVTAAQPANAQAASTTFFVTSIGIGNGGNLGGLAGPIIIARNWRRPRAPMLPVSKPGTPISRRRRLTASPR